MRSGSEETAVPIPRNLKQFKRFPSQEYAASKVRRLKRIRARAIPELSEAFAAGKLTLRQFDLISRLRPEEQRSKMAHLHERIESARIAAETIDEILNRTKGTPGSVRLSEISAAICEAVQAACGLQNGNHGSHSALPQSESMCTISQPRLRA